MSGYNLAYRFGFTPWETYVDAASASIDAVLDRESQGRPDPPGRALDLGCGRGLYTRRLAQRGWTVVGLDAATLAIEAAQREPFPGTSFVVGDVTNLPAAGLGTFDLLLDVGCFQGLRPAQRRAMGEGVTAAANPGAVLLMLQFRPTRMARIIGGASRSDIEAAFPAWSMLSVEDAQVLGLGRHLERTAPVWYRLRLDG